RATGGGAGSEVAELVEGDGAYRVVGVEGWVVDAEVVGEGAVDFGFEGGFVECGVGTGDCGWGLRICEFGVAAEGGVGAAGGLVALEGHQAFAFAEDDELGVVDEAHAVLGGEALGS